jgi:hypothetical protein
MPATLARYFEIIPLLVCCAWAPDAAAQLVNTSAAGGSGGTAFSLRCPTNTILIGVRGRAGLAIDSIRGVCSQYANNGAGGTRIGTLLETTAAGGGGGKTYERICGYHDAVSGFTAQVSSVVHSLAIRCSSVDSRGLASGASSMAPVGTAGTPGTAAVTVICPDRRLGVGLVGRAGSLIDAQALACNGARLAGTFVHKPTFNHPSGVSGAPEMGTVSLNGYALNATTVNFSLYTQPANSGISVNSSVTIPAGASSAAFQVSSAATTASCAYIEASALNTRALSEFVLTPPPAPDAGFSFALVDPPTTLIYPLTIISPTRNIGARISVGTALRQLPLIAPATFRVASSAAQVSVPTSVTIPAGSSSVNFVARATGGGCAVITVTSPSGKSIRRVLLVKG